MARPTRPLVVAFAIALGLSGRAQTQIGTLVSEGPFVLRGAHVTPSPGIPGWPVMPGDAFHAGDKLLTLMLPTGSTIVMAPHAAGRVFALGGGLVFELTSGSAHYDLGQGPSNVTVRISSDTKSAAQTVGDLNCDRYAALLPAKWWVGAGTAAAVAGAVIHQRNGPPVSPTQCNNGNGRGTGLPPCP